MSNFRVKTVTSYQSGFLLLEMIFCVSALIGLMKISSIYVQKNIQKSTNQVLANQMIQVTKAANNYVKDNYKAFFEVTDPKREIKLKEDLLDRAYLSHAFFKNSGKNLYNQEYIIQVIPEKNDNDTSLLQVLVTTRGGQAIDEFSLRDISAHVGGG